MILTILAWCYISLLCWLWGMLVISILKKVSNEPGYDLPHFSIICLTGLAAITGFAGIFSLFIPLGGWLMQLLMAAPCFLFLSKPVRHNLYLLKNSFIHLNPVIFFLLLACCLMVLVMSSWKIIHPDTLAYHAQVIQWIEKYRVIPGLINLEERLGLQNYWFIACALFSFKFTGTAALTFINSTLLLWFFIFIAYKIHKAISEPGRATEAFLWLLLLGLSLAGYTQVRLTAASANPDFIAAIYVWLVLYLLVISKHRVSSSVHLLLIIFFSAFAMAIKLSVLPVILAAVYAGISLLRDKKIKEAVLAVSVVAIVMIPFLARNIITSGYPAFPSPVPDIANVDWKYDIQKTIKIKKFVTGYARAVRSFSTEEIIAGDDMKLRQWLPGWWKNIFISDKFIFILLVLSLLLSLSSIKKISRLETGIIIALLVSLTGIIFWFIQAPDPRFGFGFILGYPAIIAAGLLPSFSPARLMKVPVKWVQLMILAAGISIYAYTAYRFSNFFSREQIVQPMGIEFLPSETINCNGQSFNLATNREACAAIAVPCILDSCVHFIPRGKTLEEGFRPK